MAIASHAKAARTASANIFDRKRLGPAGYPNDLVRTPRIPGLGILFGGWRAAAVAVFGLVLLACVGKASPPHIGNTARPDNRAPLASLPAGETTWTAKDLKVHYRAAAAGENLNISGFVEFGSNLGKFPLIDTFRVYLHFLDAEGLVLDTKLLWVTGIRQEARFVRWTFERQWPMPPNTEALGFSYRGAASEAGGKGSAGQSRTGWEVYQSP